MDYCVIRSSKEEERTLTSRWFCWPRYVGAGILICGRKRSFFPLQCFVGPDWPCMLCTYFLILGPTGLFLGFIARKLHIAVIAVAMVTFLITICAYSVAACSDPGIAYKVVEQRMVSSSIDALEAGLEGIKRKECGQCDMMRPATAQHCYECKVCIHDLDHHCPWTGKCIGKRTIGFFNIFLQALCFHILFVGGTTLYWLFTSR